MKSENSLEVAGSRLDFFSKVSANSCALSMAEVAYEPSTRRKGGITSREAPKDINDFEMRHHSRLEGFKVRSLDFVRTTNEL